MEANFDAKHVDDAKQKSKKKKPRYACLKHMFEKQRLGNDATPPESCSSSYTKTVSTVLNNSSSVLMFLRFFVLKLVSKAHAETHRNEFTGHVGMAFASLPTTLTTTTFSPTAIDWDLLPNTPTESGRKK